MKVDTSNMTMVYVAGGNGARDNYKELKWSIRSLKNVKYKNLVVIGKDIDWLSKDVLIEVDDCMGIKHANVINKLLIACDSDKVSENFILMNDDFFFMRPQDIRKFKKKELFMLSKGKGARYKAVIENTLDELEIPNPEDYELHYPMIINKVKFKEILNKYPWKSKELLHRSIYGNEMDEKDYTEISRDFKVYTYDEWLRYKNGPFISTSERVVNFTGVSKDLNSSFKSPSIYEVK